MQRITADNSGIDDFCKNAKNGQQLRLKDKGIPNKTAGHLYLIINIVLPPAHSEQEQQAYQQFADAFASFRPRAS